MPKISFLQTIWEDSQLRANQLNKLRAGSRPVFLTSAKGLMFWVRLTWVQANAFVGRSEKELQDQESIQRTKTRALGSLDIGLYNLTPT